MTVEAWAESWLSRPGKRANSRATDASALRTHIIPALGARKLGSVTPVDVQQLVNELALRLKPRTVRRIYGVLATTSRAASGTLTSPAAHSTVSAAIGRGEHGEPVLGEPKSNAGRRSMAVPPTLMAILAAHLGNRTDPDALVFPAAGGGSSPTRTSSTGSGSQPSRPQASPASLSMTFAGARPRS